MHLNLVITSLEIQGAEHSNTAPHTALNTAPLLSIFALWFSQHFTACWSTCWVLVLLVSLSLSSHTLWKGCLLLGAPSSSSLVLVSTISCTHSTNVWSLDRPSFFPVSFTCCTLKIVERNTILASASAVLTISCIFFHDMIVSGEKSSAILPTWLAGLFSILEHLRNVLLWGRSAIHRGFFDPFFYNFSKRSLHPPGSKTCRLTWHTRAVFNELMAAWLSRSPTTLASIHNINRLAPW